MPAAAVWRRQTDYVALRTEGYGRSSACVRLRRDPRRVGVRRGTSRLAISMLVTFSDGSLWRRMVTAAT
jgi:hypothetical protein